MLHSTLKVRKANICFFSSVSKKAPAILEGKLDYNEAFKAFLKSTNQKDHTANLVGLFIKKLQQKNAFRKADDRIKVADIGCADGSACMGYFNRIGYAGGFEYTGVDINSKFLEEAESVITQNAAVKKHTLINGDILTGGLKVLPGMQKGSSDLVFVSHVAYYLKNAKNCRVFAENMLQLLNSNGLAIFLHEDSTHYYRSTYNSTYTNMNAPQMLRDSASSEKLKERVAFFEIPFTSMLTFSKMTEQEWEALKNPALYKNYSHLPGFVENLNKLAFIAQCDLRRIFDEGKLGLFVDEMKKKLVNNNYCFELTTSMQILASSTNPNIKLIEASLKETQLSSVLLSEANYYLPEQRMNVINFKQGYEVYKAGILNALSGITTLRAIGFTMMLLGALAIIASVGIGLGLAFGAVSLTAPFGVCLGTFSVGMAFAGGGYFLNKSNESSIISHSYEAKGVCSYGSLSAN